MLLQNVSLTLSAQEKKSTHMLTASNLCMRKINQKAGLESLQP